MPDIDNKNYIPKEIINNILPCFIEVLKDIMKQKDKTDFLLFTDSEELVKTFKNDYPRNETIWIKLAETKLSLFSEAYKLWMIFTAKGHPTDHLKDPEEHVFLKKIITEPEKYKKFTQKMIKKYPELSL